MTPPTEDKLQSRIDMREEAENALRSCKFGNCITTWAHMSVEVIAKHVLKLLDEIEELETTIATQACDIAEYQREREPHPYDSHEPRDYQ